MTLPPTAWGKMIMVSLQKLKISVKIELSYN
jgi:hypothetical protein